MKFDVVVGNPPYQEENVGNNQAIPVYNYFYNLAETIAEKYILISPARFLANQGATSKKWNKRMLNDKHINIEYFNPKSTEVFPNVEIKGGIVILYRDQNKDFGAIDTFIPYRELRSIYHKVKKITQGNISAFVYSPDSYRFSDELFVEHPELNGRTDYSHAKAVASSVFSRYPEIFFNNAPSNDKDYIQIYGRVSGERVFRWIKRKYIVSHSNLDKWKVFVPGANGTGEFGETISTPVLGHPAVGHSQTFVSLGAFDTKFEAKALLKYIESKFGRAMLGIMKTTQNNQSKSTWSKVPLQDFTLSSDIDWTKSLPEINQQLYKKYELDPNEINFIEKKVKAMD
ncbi:Eco57I restriction-modification methylase domain-containing protein [Pediococcus ethanolidurans]